MRGRSDGGQKKRLIIALCVVAIFLGFLYAYYGSIFGSSSRGAAALEYGSRSLRKLGSSYLGGDDDADGKQYEGEEDAVPKTFPVSFFTAEACLSTFLRSSIYPSGPPSFSPLLLVLVSCHGI